MLITLCKCKIHRATITEANLQYMGSLTVDRDLMDAAGLHPYEKVAVVKLLVRGRLSTGIYGIVICHMCCYIATVSCDGFNPPH